MIQKQSCIEDAGDLVALETGLIGVLSALTASSIWSLSPGLISRYGKGTDATTLNMLRGLHAVFVLFLIFHLTINERWFVPEGIFIVYISAFFGPLLGDTLYIYSIKHIGGGNAVSISYTYIFFAQLYSYLLYGEQLRIQLILGSFIAIIGVYLVYSGQKNDIKITGFIAALGAALSWGMGATLSKLALNYGDPVTIALLRNLSTTISLLPITYNSAKKVFLDKEIQITAFITGGIGFGVGMTLFLTAINTIGVSATVLATSLTPVLGRILAKFIAGEKPSPKTYLGTIITSTGIFIGLYF
ncbi:DMT family transporter [Staphylothermus hellenicus]|uniref:EamA domain-containing protein n=1 Tax=Staphylothermus hellenicus (strain DSM 12710 / JCM 10830 / BK20S6-10-b1 / P8) TaxID=591019 RepID=D7DAP4_STAHD|nr:DMT family transporter [Staphylothermus hellenicus]ADI31241.1 protein of unknown function DUF6 transmembrane [Staphylothermus hellenicus DSM 12710]